MKEFFVPLSVGEFLDRYSILLLKKKYFPYSDPRLLCVENEIAFYIKSLTESGIEIKDCELFQALLLLNQEIWKLEETWRKDLSDEDFLQTARLVPKRNDERAKLKQQLNEKYKSRITDVKSHF